MRKRLFILIIAAGIIALVLVLPFATHLLQAKQFQPLPAGNTGVSGELKTQGWPLISQNVPAFASSGYTPASNANDGSYDTTWRSQGASSWLAYNLSSVPAAQRSKVLVVWYNETSNYDHTLIGYPAYNMPQNYTIDVNPAPDAGQAPTMGWVTRVTVQSNHYHSRQHLVEMAGYNWIRIHVTAIDGSIENEDANINMDVFDASTALTDDWIFFGDSITEEGMGHQTLNGIAAFAQLIHTRVPRSYPAQENGGIGYFTSANGEKNLTTWLGLFSGKYVGLSYGTNDALGCANPGAFYSTYLTMVQDVLRVGKTPIVPRIPWGRQTNIQQCGPALNAQINKLYRAFPQIIHGPDLWSFFQNHQNLISNDNIHPTETGFAAYRQQWADAMLVEVYKA